MNKFTKVGVAVAAAAAVLLAAGCASPQGDYCVKPAAKVASCKGVNSCKGKNTCKTSK